MVFPMMYTMEKIKKYQKLYVGEFAGSICHNRINNDPLSIAPINMYGRRRPNLDFVLSVMYPMIGSVRASKNRGSPPRSPARNGSIPNAVNKKKENTPSAPGNRLLTRFPAPNAAFCNKGTRSLAKVICSAMIPFLSYIHHIIFRMQIRYFLPDEQ